MLMMNVTLFDCQVDFNRFTLEILPKGVTPVLVNFHYCLNIEISSFKVTDSRSCLSTDVPKWSAKLEPLAQVEIQQKVKLDISS